MPCENWTELKHNGPTFADPYTPLPYNVKVKYNSVAVDLDSKDISNEFKVSAEEAATFYAIKLAADSRNTKKILKLADNPRAQRNFWNDWSAILGKNSPIKNLEGVDFTLLVDHFNRLFENKKKRSKEEKNDEKIRAKERKDLYGYAIIDGKKIDIAGYTIQPPTLFIGKNSIHTGKIKARILPSEITINVSKGFEPKCVMYGKECSWGSYVERKNAQWLATWTHPIMKDPDYVYLSRAKSHFVCAADMEKFEKAKKLQQFIDKTRALYHKHMISGDSYLNQHAVAVYLLDELAIRPGDDKDEDASNDTQGLTSLTSDNIKFNGGNSITLAFIGKSGVPYQNTLVIDTQAYQILYDLNNKNPGKTLLPTVTAPTLNQYLGRYFLKDLTSKVFRTWKASAIFQEELDKSDVKESDPPSVKLIAYSDANYKAALRLNHKKMGDNEQTIAKIKNSIAELDKKISSHQTELQKSRLEAQRMVLIQKLKLDEESIALGTSKINYISPQITVAWCKKIGLAIEKVYTKPLQTKFMWSMDTLSTWNFFKN